MGTVTESVPNIPLKIWLFLWTHYSENVLNTSKLIIFLLGFQLYEVLAICIRYFLKCEIEVKEVLMKAFHKVHFFRVWTKTKSLFVHTPISDVREKTALMFDSFVLKNLSVHILFHRVKCSVVVF